MRAVFIIAATVLMVVMTIFYKMTKGRVFRAIRSLFPHKYPGRDFMKQNREVYTAIIEMRALSDSDRGYVIQFHNGQEFLPSNPIWKCTCTHEVVRSGVTYESANLQNLLVSRVSELVEPIISASYDGAGVMEGPKCRICPFKTDCDSKNKRIAVVQVDEMSSGFAKFMLEEQNIKTLLMCGIVSKNGVFGIVGVDICGRKISEEETLIKICECVCQTAGKVQNILHNGKTPSYRIPKKSQKKIAKEFFFQCIMLMTLEKKHGWF